MYNETLKKRYILEKEKQVIIDENYLERLFNKTSKIEEEYNKDIHDFTVYEIKEFYKMLNSSSRDSLYVMNSQLSMYVQWCLSQNLVVDNQNHFLEITAEDVKSCLNKAILDQKIITKEMIDKLLKDVLNPRDRFVILGLFEGLKGHSYCELTKLRPGDIEWNIAKLCTNRTVYLSEELIKIIQECIKEDTYNCYGSTMRQMPLVDRGYVFKNYPNVSDNISDFQAGRNMYMAFQRMINYSGMPSFVNMNNIYESGKLNMIKKRARELGMTDIEYINSDYIREVDEQYNCRIIRTQFILKYQDYLD